MLSTSDGDPMPATITAVLSVFIYCRFADCAAEQSAQRLEVVDLEKVGVEEQVDKRNRGRRIHSPAWQ